MTNADQDLSRLLQEGFEALNRGELDVAAKACQSALSQRPDLAPAHFLVGLVAVEGEERRVAHEAFKSVVKIDRDHAAAWAQLARLNASEGRIALAESALKEVRRIQPSDPAVLDLTGTVLNQLGEYENVFDEFTWDGYNANGGILPSHFFGPMRPMTIGVRAGMSWD